MRAEVSPGLSSDSAVRTKFLTKQESFEPTRVMPIDIVLDAMGSDRSPDPEIRGAILACRQLDVRVHLVGPEDLLRPKLREALKATARPAFPGTPGFPGKKPRLPIFMVQAS